MKYRYCVFNYKDLSINKDTIIFPTGHKIYSTKEINNELTEFITLSLLMGYSLKIRYSHHKLSFCFTMIYPTANDMHISFKINKNNRISHCGCADLIKEKSFETYSPNNFANIIKKFKHVV